MTDVHRAQVAETLRSLSEDEAVVAASGSGAAERAYALLRTAILRHLLGAGTLLNEAELADSLGISRTPVRSALQMLQQEGMVEAGARRQLYVRDFDPADRREVIMLREALERVAVAEASKVIEMGELDELRLVLIRQRRAADQNDVEAFIELDDQFHLGIARGARLPTLQRFLGQLRAFVRMIGLRLAAQEGRMQEVLQEHEAIVAALEARDGQAALAAIDHHLARTYARLGELDP
jgi:DNA-binding GntR family transcriptional regulator